MGLADVFAEPTPDRFSRGQTCSIMLVYLALERDDPEGLAVLRAAIDDPIRWTGTEIAKRCQQSGVMLAAPAIQRHRRRECRCPS